MQERKKQLLGTFSFAEVLRGKETLSCGSAVVCIHTKDNGENFKDERKIASAIDALSVDLVLEIVKNQKTQETIISYIFSKVSNHPVWQEEQGALFRVLCAICRHKNVSQHILQKCLDNKKWTRPIYGLSLLKAIATNPNCRPATLEYIATNILGALDSHDHEELCLSLAKNKNLKGETIYNLYKQSYQFTGRYLAKLPNTTFDIFKEIVSNENMGSALREIAQSHNLSEEKIEYLANMNNYWINKGLSTNITVNEKILDKLSVDEAYDIRKCVAENIATSTKTLSKLLYDDDTEVRYSAIKNLKTHISDLKTLLKDAKFDEKQLIKTIIKIRTQQ